MSKKALIVKKLVGVAFVIPALACIFIFSAYPMYEIFHLSFSRVDLATFTTEFIGFANYGEILSNRIFWQAGKNMVIWGGVYVPVLCLLGLLAALALNRKIKRVGRAFRIVVFLPWTISLVSITLSWMWLLQTDYGLVNSFLRRAGFASVAQDWLSNPSLALYTVMLVNTWHRYPFVMLLLLAGLQTVPEDLISAARVDGANKLQIFFYVTVPWLRTIIGLTLILSVISALQAFTTIWVLTGGGPANSTQLFSTLIYRSSFVNLDWATATGISVILLVISSAVIIPYVYLATKKA